MPKQYDHPSLTFMTMFLDDVDKWQISGESDLQGLLTRPGAQRTDASYFPSYQWRRTSCFRGSPTRARSAPGS